MKKFILFTLLASSLYANGGIYIGASYGAYNENFTKGSDKDIQSDSFQIKTGYGLINSYAVEINLEKINNNSGTVTSGTTPINIKSNSKYGLNVALLKSFDPSIYVYPFIRAGFGAGVIGVDTQGKDLEDKPKQVNTLTYGSLNFGAGVFIPLGKKFDLEIAYQYRMQSYENLDDSTTNAQRGPEFESTLHNITTGINYRF